MDGMDQVRRLCGAYLRERAAAHKVDVADFVGYMESAFKKHGFRTLDRTKRERILVIRMDGIRGAVMTTGFLRELRKNRPRAHIALAVNPAAYPLMEKCPHVDEVHEFDSGSGTALQDILQGTAGFCRRNFWKHHYDICFCPQWDADPSRTLLLAFLSGARERVGYGGAVPGGEAGVSSGGARFLTRAVTSPPECIHDVARAFYLLQLLGMRVQDDALELWIDRQEEVVAHRILVNFKERHPLAVLALGAGQACKKYPVEQYVAALQPVAASGVKFVLLGGSDVDLEGNFVTRHMPRGAVMNLIGQTSLRVMAAVLSMASLYIGNDTSLVYMAAALGIPVIELLPEAEDKKEDRSVYSLYERDYPWKTPAIVLRPRHALPPCSETAALGGCCATMPHCICRIPPEDVAAAYRSMADYLRENPQNRR